MKRQKLLVLILFFCFIISGTLPINVYASTIDTTEEDVWPQGPSVYAESAIVMEASTGLVFYEKNMHDIHYPASITKILTALLAIENSSLNETVTFSRESVYDILPGSSHIGMDEGEQITMEQALYGILLESANEVSYAVAEHVGGSIEGFADMMNKRAKELGCLDTNFVNPHGLPDSEHVTTAYDMALITREAIKNKTFLKIFGTRTYQIPPTNIQSETRYLAHHHRFILKRDFFYDDCIGGKTGYTDTARYTLVSVAKRGDLELIVVVMKDDTFEHQYTDTQKLFDFGFDNFSIYSVADLEDDRQLSDSPLFTKYNSMLSMTDSPITTDQNGYLVLPNTASYEDAKKQISFLSSDEMEAGSNVIGTISYTYQDKYVGGADILYNVSETPTLTTLSTTKENPTTEPEEFVPNEQGDNLRPIIIGFIVGIFVLIIIIYYILVERPRIKRRNAYYKKRARRKLYKNDDFLDL